MTRSYEHDLESKVWKRSDQIPLLYSDGELEEAQILRSLKNAADVSSSSPELSAAINDWPSEYHLSRKRRNLLLPFTFTQHHAVLELGCGCGAITRHLGETGAKVVAVEGSATRAEIAAERCRDLSNVNIYCDNISDFSCQEKFDFVTLIGVLEYAPKYSKSADPVNDYLKVAKQFLKPEGVLILAIENQLGLKYFNGCGEDHLSIPYFGIQDRYTKDSPITFGRLELQSRVLAAGYQACQFYYPFPDYKLPSIILSEKALDRSDFNVADLLCMVESRDYSGINHRNFKENRVWPILARNKMIEDLANSFLLIAPNTGSQSTALEPISFLAATYATERHAAYATETRFLSTDEGVLVTKKLLHPSHPAVSNHSCFHHQVVETPYCEGRLLLAEFQCLMASDAGIPALAKILQPWMTLLSANSLNKSLGTLSGVYLDCIPRNIICSKNGSISVIDTEWAATESIPASWVVVRGLADCIFSSLIPENLRHHTVGSLISLLAEACGIPVTDALLVEIAKREDSFQEWVGARDRSPNFSECLTYRLGFNDLAQLENELAIWKDEVIRIKTSVSWQITKPLRLLGGMIRLFIQHIK